MSKSLVDSLSSSEALYLNILFGLQARKPNGVSVDYLPWTANLNWIVAEMAKKFPKKTWTGKLIHRTLMAARKAGYLEKTEKTGGKIEVPEFPTDDDVNESVIEVEAVVKPEPPAEDTSGQ